MRNSSGLRQKLEQLGLSRDEASIFFHLLDGPKTQLGVSRVTGIARSNVYRITDVLMDRGLLSTYTSPSGKQMAVAHPDALELLVLEQEQLAEEQRKRLDQILPLLAGFRDDPESFTIRTYIGVKGIKQMLWNELQAKSEILVFSGYALDVATGRRWAEKFRSEVIERGVYIRSIQNIRDRGVKLSAHDEYEQHYRARYVSDDWLDIQLEISVYDNKVCIYNSLPQDSRLGTEITNPFLVRFMRQVFEHYWSVAE
jgi:sugar-specific transcriptional regulator TrmB